MEHSLERKIPATMATQHPDNASIPYWMTKAFVSTAKEVEECYRSFADLGCQEYMWDWEGKFVDEAVVDRLYQRYLQYFTDHPLGREKFLTFRIPNIQKEGRARLARAFTGILSASYSAQQINLPTPPIFEVIHPMTNSVKQLTDLQRKFHETVEFQQEILEVKNLKPKHLEIIPLIEGTGALLKSRKILEQYTAFFEKFTGRRPRVIRPFIARSDPALDGGFVAAVLSAKAALSEYYSFQKQSGIVVRPIIGVGSLRFRGGLSPATIDEFLRTYPGISTVTLQSSFRYDHPLEEVKKAIQQLNRSLPTQPPAIYTAGQFQELTELDEIFVEKYRMTIVGLEKFIIDLAKYIPQRRERLQHTGHFGYSRQIGGTGLSLPRAITFTSVFYSVGVPPEFIGMGRGLKEAKARGLLKKLLFFYPDLNEIILKIGRYLNRENLEILAKRYELWDLVRTGLGFLEEYIGEKMGPLKPDEILHRNYTSNVLQKWLQGSDPQEDIILAAQIRRSLG